MKQAKADLYDVFCKPWESMERIRSFLSERDGLFRVMDKEIASEMEIKLTSISAFKSRDSTLFSMYIMKWCIKKGYDPVQFIKKKETA